MPHGMIPKLNNEMGVHTLISFPTVSIFYSLQCMVNGVQNSSHNLDFWVVIDSILREDEGRLDTMDGQGPKPWFYTYSNSSDAI